MSVRSLLRATAFGFVAAFVVVVAVEATAQDGSEDEPATAGAEQSVAVATVDFGTKLESILRPEERARLPRDAADSLPAIDARAAFFFADKAIRIAAAGAAASGMEEEAAQLRAVPTVRDRTTAVAAQVVIHTIVSPRDASTGQATGKRQHVPIRVRTYYDQASRILTLALAHEQSWSRSPRARNFFATTMFELVRGAIRGGADRALVIDEGLQCIYYARRIEYKAGATTAVKSAIP